MADGLYRTGDYSDDFSDLQDKRDTTAVRRIVAAPGARSFAVGIVLLGLSAIGFLWVIIR